MWLKSQLKCIWVKEKFKKKTQKFGGVENTTAAAVIQELVYSSYSSSSLDRRRLP